ncbi:MAG: VWA domain-containing protein [Desulfobacteraceae bacterium]|nr:MAG: VWA domain-containing protein [Desulfobacteraceae bacterium]
MDNRPVENDPWKPLELFDPEQTDTYEKLVGKAEQESGPTLAGIMAESLVPVLASKDPALLAHFLVVVRIMQSKGVYALASPLSTLTFLLRTGNLSAGKTFLHVLENAFSQEMNYNQCKQVASRLAQDCLRFPDHKKTWMMKALCRVIRQDVMLAEPFIDSLKGDLEFLDHQGLSAFVAMGLEKYQKNPDAGEKFFSLKTQAAREACLELQSVVPLKQVQHRLNRYIQASTGLPLRVRPITAMPNLPVDIHMDEPCVLSDGRYLYLPEEIHMGGREAGWNLYKVLARLEAGYDEFQTFAFDLHKALDRCRAEDVTMVLPKEEQIAAVMSMDLSDMERFFHLFPNPRLASDLFTVFEHGRIRALMHRKNPGVIRQAAVYLQQSCDRRIQRAGPEAVLLPLYAAVAVHPESTKNDSRNPLPFVNRFSEQFFRSIQKDDTVEAIAGLVLSSYHEVKSFLQMVTGNAEEYPPAAIPFNRSLRPELHAGTASLQQKKAEQIQRIFHTKGIRTYRSDIQKKLDEHSGNLSRDDIRALALHPEETGPQAEETIRNIIISVQRELFLDKRPEEGLIFQEQGSYPSFRYHEWDMEQGDYLEDHVLVREKQIPEKQGTFYADTVALHHGLIRRIRHSFELLKPEGLTILRRWIEGDEFDYRAMLDFAIEKKIGLTPSERIYMKRIKQVRDVSVLVLVDLSRSTANLAAGTDKSVLTIEKEAIVLLCEALTVVGDAFSIAGFSGTGRLGVDYFSIKEFHEEMKETVRQRIHAMQPLRSTRLGAAIRHASSRLAYRDSKVRLLLIISDGFPNDNGYKQEYAIQDTRKALLEARSKNLFTHSITVNITGSAQLDHLYGKLHHSVISDVCELPDKLLRIYGNLTR